MINGIVEIVLNISEFKLMAYKVKGAHFASLTLLYLHNSRPIPAVPIQAYYTSSPEKPINLKDKLGDTDYLTDLFEVYHEVNKVNQTVVFRIQIPVSQHSDFNEIEIKLKSKLFRCSSSYDSDLTEVSSFEGLIRNPLLPAQHLDIRYLDNVTALLSGSIHCILYDFKFKNNNQLIEYELSKRKERQASTHVRDLEDSKELKPIWKLEQLIHKLTSMKPQLMWELFSYYLKYLQNSFKALRKEVSCLLKLEEMTEIEKIVLPSSTNKSIRRKGIFNDEIKTITLTFQQQVLQSKEEQRNQLCALFMHDCNKLGQTIYEYWSLYIKKVQNKLRQLLPILSDKYYMHARQEWGQSIISMTDKRGSRSLSGSCSNLDLRKICQSLRNKELFKPKILRFIDKKFFPEKIDNVIIHQQDTRQGSTNFEGDHVFVLVHGFQASKADMYNLRNAIKEIKQNAFILISTSNQGMTSGDIRDMSFRLCREVQAFLSQNFKEKDNFRLTFIGHSMGGIIIRAAVQKLKKYHSKMYVYMSLSSPHIGYMYNSTLLINTALKLLSQTQNIVSLKQLSMEDNPSLQDTLLNELSWTQTFSPFKKIVLVGSFQDLYVPYESARIQIGNLDEKECKQSVKGKIYSDMIRNNLQSMRNGELHRICVDFTLEQNLDNLIGRAAHIKFITDSVFLRIFVRFFQNLFFK